MQNQLLYTAIDAALHAGKAILEVYKNEKVESKLKQDKSPLTLADKNAHNEILRILESTKIPVLSEEGRSIPFQERKNWEYFWMVDPLDGTKEFINRNGDFTVNIALIKNNEPVLGVVYVPVTGTLYFAEKGAGAFRQENCNKFTIEEITELSKLLPVSGSRRLFTVVASRSHMNNETKDYIQKLEKVKGKVELASRGSSLKICMVAEGSADVYPRFGPTMEWDTAAGHAVAVEAGCSFLQGDGHTPFIYNKENLLNPYFIVSGKIS